MNRASVDTAFAVVFIMIAVAILYPAVFMFLYNAFGPAPPPLPGEVQDMSAEERARFAGTDEAKVFLGFSIAWFIAGCIIPWGIALGAQRAARRIFRAARPTTLRPAAVAAVLLLYAGATLFLLRP